MKATSWRARLRHPVTRSRPTAWRPLALRWRRPAARGPAPQPSRAGVARWAPVSLLLRVQVACPVEHVFTTARPPMRAAARAGEAARSAAPRAQAVRDAPRAGVPSADGSAGRTRAACPAILAFRQMQAPRTPLPVAHAAVVRLPVRHVRVSAAPANRPAIAEATRAPTRFATMARAVASTSPGRTTPREAERRIAPVVRVQRGVHDGGTTQRTDRAPASPAARAAANGPTRAAVPIAEQARALALVWRRVADAQVPSDAGSIRALAPARPMHACEPAPAMQAASVRSIADASRAVLADPQAVDRLAEDVVQRIERRLRIERERRGM